MAAVSEHRTLAVRTAHEWSVTEFIADGGNSKATFRRPEYVGTRKIRVTTKGWAVKKNPPSVHMPLPVRKVLLQCFDKRPYLSPEESLRHPRGRPEFQDDLFVEYFVTPTRIKGFFGRLLKYKRENKNAVDANEKLNENAAGGEDPTEADTYKDCKTKDDLKDEIRNRGLHVGLHVGGIASKKKSELMAIPGPQR
jgi:hypothetical protein